MRRQGRDARNLRPPDLQWTGSSAKLAGYLWASPASALGAILGAVGIAAGGRMAIHSGVLEVEGRLLAWGLKHLTVLDGGADAITFGHVVLARDA